MTDFSNDMNSGASQATDDTRRYAGFWIRVLALVIDSIIIMAFLYGLLMPLLGLSFHDFYHLPTQAELAAHKNGQPLPPPTSNPALTIFSIFGWIVPFAYYVVLVSSTWQATLGKRAMGIYIETENHARLSWLNALGREAAKLISGLILGIGYLMVAFTKEKTGLHDIIARTRVVYGKK